MMANDDCTWVFDSLIGFLNGPVWNGPLQNFIEEKSLIFESGNVDEQEYHDVHEEFKNLVDFMLGTYMEEIGITPEQFETACNSGMQEVLPVELQDNLFEQIWAANDFEIFKRMMIDKNIELQLQALEMIEQKYGKTSTLFSETTPDDVPPLNRAESIPEVPKSEKEVLVEVIRQCEPDNIENIETLQPETEEENNKTEQKETLENHEDKEVPVLETEKFEIVQEQEVEKKNEFEIKPKLEVKEEDLLKRQEYLKAQRDKLIALKKQLRKKQLENEIETAETENKRPKSAKTAEAVMTGSVNIEPETLKFRKALAEKLRSEVIAKGGK